MSSLLEPLKQAAESGYGASVGSKETRKCVPMIVSYCYYIQDAMDLSAARHCAERQHSWTKWHITYEDIVMGRWSSVSVVAQTVETRREVKRVARRG